MADYTLYDMPAIAREAHKLLPQYTEEELRAWSVPEIIKYLEKVGHVFFGRPNERRDQRPNQ